MKCSPSVSIIIVHYQAGQWLKECINSIAQHIPHEQRQVIVIDNASPDHTWRDQLPADVKVTLLINPTNVGFGAACNEAVTHAQGEYLFFLNPDCYFVDNPIPQLVNCVESFRDAAGVGPLLKFPTGTLQPSRGTFPHLALTFAQLFRLKKLLPKDEHIISLFSWCLGSWFAQWKSATTTHSVDYVTGAALLLRRSVFEAVGGFDEQFFLYFEEIDLAKRLSERGLRLYFCPDAVLYHHEDKADEATPGSKELAYYQSLLLYYQKHGSATQQRMVRLFVRLAIAVKWASGGRLLRTAHGSDSDTPDFKRHIHSLQALL